MEKAAADFKSSFGIQGLCGIIALALAIFS